MSKLLNDYHNRAMELAALRGTRADFGDEDARIAVSRRLWKTSVRPPTCQPIG